VRLQLQTKVAAIYQRHASAVINYITTTILKLVVCILLCVLGQVQGFRLTQHCFEYFRLKIVTRTKHVEVIE
jgi:hypothetical protein